MSTADRSDADADGTAVALTVDGDQVELSVAPETSLLRALRDAGHLATTGACEQGECGSCSVLLDGRMVCSCLVPAVTCASAEVRTVTSLCAPDVADALVAHGAVQCGFCTPGFVVAIETALRTAGDRVLSTDEMHEHLAGNLCRCTGYAGLVTAALEVQRARLAAGEGRST